MPSLIWSPLTDTTVISMSSPILIDCPVLLVKTSIRSPLRNWLPQQQMLCRIRSVMQNDLLGSPVPPVHNDRCLEIGGRFIKRILNRQNGVHEHILFIFQLQLGDAGVIQIKTVIGEKMKRIDDHKAERRSVDRLEDAVNVVFRKSENDKFLFIGKT